MLFSLPMLFSSNTQGGRIGLGGRDRMLTIRKKIFNISSSCVKILVPIEKISFLGSPKVGEKQYREKRDIREKKKVCVNNGHLCKLPGPSQHNIKCRQGNIS